MTAGQRPAKMSERAACAHLSARNLISCSDAMLVCVLLGYLPFSKLAHMAGVFLSPTRNLANSNRRVRHVNAWDYPVKVHSYEEYEDELREKMRGAGLPLEKQDGPVEKMETAELPLEK